MPPRSSSLIQSSPVFCGTPSLLTRSRSRSISSDGPSTPSVVSVFGADSVVLTKGNGCEDDEVDIALIPPRDRDFDVLCEDTLSDSPHPQAVPEHTPEHLRAQADPPPTVWGLAMRRHRRSHGKGTSFLSFGSGDSSATTASAFSSMQSPTDSPDSYFPPVPPVRAARTAPSTPVAERYDSYLVVDSAPMSKRNISGTEIGDKKPMGTFRRLLRSFSSVALRT
ncbi:hypothetical protein C8R45DRAFT_1034870 [Mycena sanguinolenta]|nr:hypothetical protein C8R45DRAFT_1034870 [Mycena sanguinolenta]